MLHQTEDSARLQCEVLGVSPKPKVEWQDRAGNKLPAEEPQVTERGGSYDIVLQTTVTKTDHYSCVVTQEEICHQAKAETHVFISGPKLPVPGGPRGNQGAPGKPSVRTLDQTEDWALLQCEVRDASPEPKVEWQDRAGNKLPAEEPQVTERGGSYDIVLQTTVTKTDRFSCVVTQEEINHQTKAETFVFISVCILRDRSKENIPGAAGKPSVRTLDQTEDSALLQCEVLGVSPEPKVEWQDRAGNKLPAEEPQVTERGGSYDIVLQTTVTKTDHYSCVVTQEEICHQAKAETHVFISGPSTGWIFAAVLGPLIIVGVLAVLYKKGCIKLDCKKGQRGEEQGVKISNVAVVESREPKMETERNGQREPNERDNLNEDPTTRV
ncbi:uncharacterized protein ABDE67_022437 [Symphorus nematophorus]